jgi:hypothetical protein
MKIFLAVVVLLLVAVTADAAPRAALCTKNVPTQTCDTEKGIFSGLQTLYLASDVQYVIADNDAYTAELTRIPRHPLAVIVIRVRQSRTTRCFLSDAIHRLDPEKITLWPFALS